MYPLVFTLWLCDIKFHLFTNRCIFAVSDPSCLSHVYQWGTVLSYLVLEEVVAFLSLCQVYALLLLSQGRRGLARLSFPWQMLSPVPPSSHKSHRSMEHKQRADMGSVAAVMNLLLCAMQLISGKMIRS